MHGRTFGTRETQTSITRTSTENSTFFVKPPLKSSSHEAKHAKKQKELAVVIEDDDSQFVVEDID